MSESDPVATSTIGVQREAWTNLDPALAVMVAPPVVVTSLPVERPMAAVRRAQLNRSRANMPVGRHRRRDR